MMPINAVASKAGGVPPHPAPVSLARDDGWPPGHSAATLKRHQASIQAICDEVGRPFEEIASVYQYELLRMAAGAAIVDYLPVLVGKRVRALYKLRIDARAQQALP